MKTKMLTYYLLNFYKMIFSENRNLTLHQSLLRSTKYNTYKYNIIIYTYTLTYIGNENVITFPRTNITIITFPYVLNPSAYISG